MSHADRRARIVHRVAPQISNTLTWDEVDIKWEALRNEGSHSYEMEVTIILLYIVYISYVITYGF